MWVGCSGCRSRRKLSGGLQCVGLELYWLSSRLCVLRACAVIGECCALLAVSAGLQDTGCQFLVTVTSGGETISEDSAQRPYAGSDDALVGVQNNSLGPISSIHLSAENELFGFELDGICSPGGAPIAPGCLVQPESTEHFKSTNPAGTECVYEGEERKGKAVTEQIIENCAFNPPQASPQA